MNMQWFNWADDEDGDLELYDLPLDENGNIEYCFGSVIIPGEKDKTVNKPKSKTLQTKVQPKGKYDGEDDLVDNGEVKYSGYQKRSSVVRTRIVYVDPDNQLAAELQFEPGSTHPILKLQQQIEDQFDTCCKYVKDLIKLFGSLLSGTVPIRTYQGQYGFTYVHKYTDVLESKYKSIRAIILQRELSKHDAPRCFRRAIRNGDGENVIINDVPISLRRITYSRGLEIAVYVEQHHTSICKEFFRTGTCSKGEMCQDVHVSKV